MVTCLQSLVPLAIASSAPLLLFKFSELLLSCMTIIANQKQSSQKVCMNADLFSFSIFLLHHAFGIFISKGPQNLLTSTTCWTQAQTLLFLTNRLTGFISNQTIHRTNIIATV